MAILDVRQNGLGSTMAALRNGRNAIKPGLRSFIERETLMLESDIKAKSLTGAKGSHPFWGVTGARGDALGVRSGSTRRSVVRRVFEAGGDVVGAVGSPLPQIKLHEHGGVTGPARIPTAAMQTAAGVDRYAGISARNIPGLFLLRSRAGNLWAAFREAGALRLAYLFKPFVLHRPRKMFTRALERNQRGIVDRARAFGVRISAQLNGGR